MKLVVDSSMIRVKLTDEPTQERLDQLVSSYDRLSRVVSEVAPFEGFVVCSLSVKTGFTSFLDSINLDTDIYAAEPFYRKLNGEPHMFGESFVVGLTETTSKAELEKLAGEFGVELDREIGRGIWVLKNRPSTDRNIIEITNDFHAREEVSYAVPDFEVAIELDAGPYMIWDHYADFQYHIKEVIGEFNSNSVWDFAGLDDTVVVAILDCGITSHEDLPASRILPGKDFYDDDLDASPGHGMAHGMAVAGIIGASHTTDSLTGTFAATGIFSMNPKVKIIPVKIMSDSACPVVAGVATLLLSKADTLDALVIYDILRNSAITELQSGTITPPDTVYGFGRVDAYRAILSIARGDVNNDNTCNLADISYLIASVYQGGPDPLPDRRMGDANCDDRNNLGDITILISKVYEGGSFNIPCYIF